MREEAKNFMNNLFLAKGAPPEKVKTRRCTPHGIGDTQY
jgi:hypothetical protein